MFAANGDFKRRFYIALFNDGGSATRHISIQRVPTLRSSTTALPARI
jgi:hypothetical protein